MKEFIEFKDIENNRVVVSKERIHGVREYTAVDPDSNTVQSYVLIIVEEVGTIPVQDSYAEACNKIGIKLA